MFDKDLISNLSVNDVQGVQILRLVKQSPGGLLSLFEVHVLFLPNRLEGLTEGDSDNNPV